uniref:Phlebovirus glycoprotein G2 fusion domain-containing protein n=1 Tax=Heterorhabditis bacteriophora TaxID=37862 RepID=A0A1I7XFX9_HETBA
MDLSSRNSAINNLFSCLSERIFQVINRSASCADHCLIVVHIGIIIPTWIATTGSSLVSQGNNASVLSTTSRKVTTQKVKQKTKTTIASCNECSELNIHFFNGTPYEDGASVLNRYSVDGCKFAEFSCRSIEIL